MTQNEKTLLNNYYETKKAIDDLQKYIDSIKSAVIEIVKSNEKTEIEFASFTLRTFTTYQYSDRVEKLENQLKTLKKEEVESGTATVKSESFSPVMRAKKGGEK